MFLEFVIQSLAIGFSHILELISKWLMDLHLYLLTTLISLKRWKLQRIAESKTLRVTKPTTFLLRGENPYYCYWLIYLCHSHFFKLSSSDNSYDTRPIFRLMLWDSVHSYSKPKNCSSQFDDRSNYEYQFLRIQ